MPFVEPPVAAMPAIALQQRAPVEERARGRAAAGGQLNSEPAGAAPQLAFARSRRRG